MKLINPEVVALLLNELTDLQADLLKQCSGKGLDEYARASSDEQQCIMYVLVNSDDDIIQKLRQREQRLLTVISLMYTNPKSLFNLLDDYTNFIVD